MGTTTPPTHAPVCIEGGSKHTIPYENCRCPEGFKVDQSYIQVYGESCCKCDHIPTTQPSTLTTKIPSQPPPVCIEGGKAHKIPFKGCTCPDDFDLDESHRQVAGKLCCKCVHGPTTQPGTVTTERPTQPPNVCIYGGEKHSIPFSGCKCPKGFFLDSNHTQVNTGSCCHCIPKPATNMPTGSPTTKIPTGSQKPRTTPSGCRTCLCEKTCASLALNSSACSQVKCHDKLCHCPDGYVYNADTGLCDGQPYCPCRHKGKVYEIGDTLALSECENCLCGKDGFNCTKNLAECVCKVDGEIHQPGSVWSKPPCSRCSCVNGAPKCGTFCDKVCKKGEVVSTNSANGCCQCVKATTLSPRTTLSPSTKCPVYQQHCTYNGIKILPGESISSNILGDPCLKCSCVKLSNTDAQLNCSSHRSLCKTCDEDEVAVFESGVCCPKCKPKPKQEQVCKYSDKNYNEGDSWKIGCRTCTCSRNADSEELAVNCVKPICEKCPNGADPVTDCCLCCPSLNLFGSQKPATSRVQPVTMRKQPVRK